MTLYCGYIPNTTAVNLTFVETPTITKVSNVQQLSTALSQEKRKKNNNMYALVGEELQVCCLGMVKKETIRNQSIYVGQKVYTFDKKTLCDYYRYKVRDFGNLQENTITQTERLLANGSSGYRNFYEKQIHRCINKIKDAQRQYKTLIETIKQL